MDTRRGHDAPLRPWRERRPWREPLPPVVGVLGGPVT
jgi:hypothetical protein